MNLICEKYGTSTSSKHWNIGICVYSITTVTDTRNICPYSLNHLLNIFHLFIINIYIHYTLAVYCIL